METEYFSSELSSSLDDIDMREKKLMLKFRILLHPNKNFINNPSIFELITRVKELKLCIYSWQNTTGLFFFISQGDTQLSMNHK